MPTLQSEASRDKQNHTIRSLHLLLEKLHGNEFLGSVEVSEQTVRS